MALGRKTGGRTKGTPNKATADVRKAAQRYSPDALKELHRIMTSSESDAARVAAARELLDRGHGKSTQPLSGDDDRPPITTIQRIIISPDGARREQSSLR